MSDHLSEDDLIRRLQSIGWDKPPAPMSSFDDDERRMATNLLGKENTGKLQRLKPGQRLKPTRQVIRRVEMYLMVYPGDVYSLIPWQWRLEFLENNHKTTWRMASGEQCAFVAKHLRARGYDVRFVITEQMRAHGFLHEPKAAAEQIVNTPRNRPAARPRQERSRRFDADWLRRATQ
jgi:hypothetical protein